MTKNNKDNKRVDKKETLKSKNKVDREPSLKKNKSKGKKHLDIRKKKNKKKHNSLFSNEKDSYSFSEVLIITVLSLVIGAFACFSVFTIMSGGKNVFKISKELNKFVDAYDVLIDNYYDTVNKDDLIDSAINGMVSSLGDEYTSYSDIEAADSFNELVTGMYEGIGCTITSNDGKIMINEVYKNSPSDKAGLKANDIIIKVDNKDTKDMDISDFSDYVKGKENNNISLVILRNGKELVKNLKKDQVEIPAVSSEIYERNGKKVGYINISIFSLLAAKQFKSELSILEDKKIDSLVIDVRNNSGGYLSTVTDLVSQLLPKNDVIYQVENSKGKVKVTKDKTSDKVTYPIAVLVNSGSASASEILAAAIKDSYGGYIVGTKTYGKGTVQQVKNLSDGSMIKYTIEKWLTPKGDCINDVGIEPTDIVELDEAYYEEPTIENDNQLEMALKLVS